MTTIDYTLEETQAVKTIVERLLFAFRCVEEQFPELASGKPYNKAQDLVGEDLTLSRHELEGIDFKVLMSLCDHGILYDEAGDFYLSEGYILHNPFEMRVVFKI